MARSKQGHCALCQREDSLTFHHLIPKTLHSNKWFKKNFTRQDMCRGIDLCRDCHGAVHRFITEKQLGREFNTLEALAAHPDVAKFVAWIAPRRPGRVRTRSRSNKPSR